MAYPANPTSSTSSAKASADYARGGDAVANAAGCKRRHPHIRPHLLPALAALLLVALFVSFGQWQWNKATVKSHLQTLLDARGAEPPVHLPGTAVDPGSLRYRRVIASGHYEPGRQILVDNRIHRGQAGYHVVTPLRIEGIEGCDGRGMRVLVNRGWIPAPAEHSQTPRVSTPDGAVEVAGTAVVPGNRFFTLGGGTDGAAAGWPNVWQNLDLARYSKRVDFPLQPVVIQLAPESPAGGFAREWPRPGERLEMHVGYALQWWGFAAATAAIWLFALLRKDKNHD
ncbi:MAG: SURF1 family protein [Betaproteobacteria bacterium]|nr:SURF1 family protein [Betaproteobacteria bacterium]